MLFTHSVTLEVRLLEQINSHAGYHPILDSFMRYLAVWGILPLFAVVILIACCGKSYETRKKGWISFSSGILAFTIALIFQHFMNRPRPFISHPVRVLVCYPNDSSFPSVLMAASAGLAFGMLLHRKKISIIPLIYLILLGIARIFCGIEYPFDILAGWVLAGFAVVVCSLVANFTEIPHKIRNSHWILAGIFFCIIGSFLIYKLPHLCGCVHPKTNSTKAHIQALSRKIPESLTKGYTPSLENSLAAAVERQPFSGKVINIEVGKDNFDSVAGIKFLGENLKTGKMKPTQLSDEAEKLAHLAFQTLPNLNEVDVWAVIHGQDAGGHDDTKIIFSTEFIRRPLKEKSIKKAGNAL